MPTWKRFEDIEAWKKARILCRKIYSMTNSGAGARDFVYVRQIRAAALSVLSNIAEGFERDGNKEFVNFLSIAKGSTGEVRAQLFVAIDVSYCTQEVFDELYALCVEIGKLLAGLIRYLQSTEMKGLKFVTSTTRAITPPKQ